MYDLRSERAAIWSARGLIIAMAIVYAWFTWGHWGDTEIDCGREMYVPVDILRGKLLFRDIWYQYGPLTPYVQALAFALFGISLNVLYAMGIVLVISSALVLFEIGRSFELVLPAAMAPAIFFVAESYRPAIFNSIFPYSYTAPMGAFFGLACLFFTIKHATTGRLSWLFFAALCTSLALLTKQEFGLACFGLLGFEAVASCISQRRWKDLVDTGLVCSAGLIPAVAVYALLIWKTSAKAIFIDNWVMTPGTYTMKTIGHYTMVKAGFRFGLNEWSGAALGAAVSVGSWFAIGYVNAFVIQKFEFRRLRSIALVVVGDIVISLIVLTLGVSVGADLPGFFGQIVFPKGIYLIALIFVALAILKVWHTHGQAGALAEAALGIYAVLAGIRVMMEMLLTYGVFFNGPVFLVFTIVIARAAARGARSLDIQRRNLLVGCMLCAEALLIVIGFWPKPERLPAPLKTEFGTIYTQADRAVLFPRIISFMKTHTRNGKDILVVPEPPSLYFFSGMQSPSRWYEVQPGVLDPEQEKEFINEAESAQVHYVLLCKRREDPFGIAPFGIGYDESIYKWILANYTKIDQFGPLVDLLPANNDVQSYEPYVMEVYEKKSGK